MPDDADVIRHAVALDTAIVGNVSEHKARAIASGIVAWFKQKQQKPAG